MRLALVPLILAAILAVGPTAVHANTNQAAAERIAASLAKQFPGYDIHVAYQNGKVRLVGKVGSMENMHQVTEHVKRVPGVRVTDVDNGLQVGQNAPVVATAPMPTPQPAQRSIFTPQQKSLADVPVPMPRQDQGQRMVVVQASAQQAQPIEPPARLQSAPVALPQEQPMPNGYYAHQHMPQGQPMPQGHPMYAQQPMPQGYPMYAGMPQGQPMPAMPPQQMAYHPEAYGPQGPMPGQYNHPNLPEYAWPSYACYPNYAEVCYPKQYSPKAWPHIGPFYPYPQTPLGWRKVTLEYDRGWWWLDFDSGEPSGPFSPLFREPVRYTY